MLPNLLAVIIIEALYSDGDYARHYNCMPLWPCMFSDYN